MTPERSEKIVTPSERSENFVTPSAPTLLTHLKPGVRLQECSTGTLWQIERVERATPYATPWVHLVAVAEQPRRIDAGALLSARDGGPLDWRYA